MDDMSLFRYKAWLAVLKDIVKLYSGRTIDNIIKDLSAVIKELEKIKENERSKDRE